LRVCANEECNKEFKPKAHNAIYHSSECRRIVTNKRILAKYYEGKKRRIPGQNCITPGCITILSIYNEEDICEPCKVERMILRLVGWGWDEKKLRKEWEI